MAKARGAIILLAALLALIPALAAPADERQTIGHVEDVRIVEGGVTFKARIDSGAETSSLGVSDLVEFQRDGKPWVRFTTANDAGRALTLERPVVRAANVRRSGTAVQRRYVVSIGLCLGRVFADAEVSLADRAGMAYRVLIGRRFLADRFLIDVAAADLTKPECPEAGAK